MSLISAFVSPTLIIFVLTDDVDHVFTVTFQKPQPSRSYPATGSTTVYDRLVSAREMHGVASRSFGSPPFAANPDFRPGL